MWTRHQWSGRKTRPRATDRLESKSDGRFRGRRRPPVAVCRRPEHAVRPRVARARNRLERRPRRSTQRLRRRARLTARGETPAAFGRRCIPAGCVAPRSNTPGILARRALPAGRIAALGATLDFHHGLLALWMLALTGPAVYAQSPSSDARRVEVSAGFVWIGHALFGSREANETTGS